MLSLNYGDNISIKGDGEEGVIVDYRGTEFHYKYKYADLLGSKLFYRLVSVDGPQPSKDGKAYNNIDKEIAACLNAFSTAKRILEEGIQDAQKCYIVKCSILNGVFYKEDVVQAVSDEDAINKFCEANSIPVDLFSEGNTYSAKIFACIAEDEFNWLG